MPTKDANFADAVASLNSLATALKHSLFASGHAPSKRSWKGVIDPFLDAYATYNQRRDDRADEERLHEIAAGYIEEGVHIIETADKTWAKFLKEIDAPSRAIVDALVLASKTYVLK